MNKYLKLSLIGLLVVAIAGVSAIGVAYAQDDDPPHPHEALAELLGLTEDELRDLMHNGSTLQDLADETGVDLDAFWKEIQEDRQEYHKTRLQEAFETGDISEDQYNWMMEKFENGFMSGGHGPGGYSDRGGFGSENGIRPFGGRGGFDGEGKSFGGCGMGWNNN